MPQKTHGGGALVLVSLKKPLSTLKHYQSHDPLAGQVVSQAVLLALVGIAEVVGE